jgi:hypothetical protein
LRQSIGAGVEVSPPPLLAGLALGQGDDVPEVGGVGPVSGEAGHSVWLDLADGDGSPPGSVEPEVGAPDA